MANRRLGGIIAVKADGVQFRAKGAWDYNLGEPQKKMIAGSDGVHGFSEKPQVPFIEGAFSDSDEVDMKAVRAIRDATITLTLANGKIISLNEAIEASEGNVNTEEGEAEVRFEGTKANEIPA